MAEMHIHWTIERLDYCEDEGPATSECLIQIEGAIECDGQPAGLVDGCYLFTEEPETPTAFFEFWDLDGAACGVFEEIISHDHLQFRDPIPELLETAPGFLCVHFIALQPKFRRRSLGLEVMREFVRNFADPRTGVVLLDSRPLQHRPRGYDDFDEEVRDLPWNAPEEDQQRLMRHFLSWGMRKLPGTRFMLAAPEDLIGELAADWYPGLLVDPDDPGLLIDPDDE